VLIGSLLTIAKILNQLKCAINGQGKQGVYMQWNTQP
jgi:hypothetical protein